MIYTILTTVPSMFVAYVMVCRLNAKKRRLVDFEGWSYLLLLGGSVYTIYAAAANGQMPNMGKLFLDFGICLYFGERQFRTSKWLKRHIN